MTAHLPECECYGRNHGECALCICDRLRACEQRVRMEDDDYAYVAAQAEADGRRRGWAEALDASREAVESIRDAVSMHYRIDCEPPGKVDWSQHRKCDVINEAIAAIDALREEKK